MLVLNLKKDERIRKADTIEVTVPEIRNGKMHLGIECFSDISVPRKEVYEPIQQKQKALLSQ